MGWRVKNRLHLDIHASGGTSLTGRSVPFATRVQRVDAEGKRLVDPGATITGALTADGLDHCAMGMKDSEGNGFDINGRHRPARLLALERLRFYE